MALKISMIAGQIWKIYLLKRFGRVKLMIQVPRDKNILKDVEKAILVANIGFTPAVMGDAVRCPIPALSGERRAELAKICHEMAEQGRVRVRNIRREAIDAFKKLQKSGGATEDDVKKFEKEVQNLTDKSIADINTQLSRKEEDLKKI